MAWIASSSQLNFEDLALELQLKHAILEGVLKCQLASVQPNLIRWEEFDRGVAFGDNAEIRFRRLRHTGLHAVVISDVAPPSGAWHSVKQLIPFSRDFRVALWGEPDEEAQGWYEGRIPIRLDYSLPARGDKNRVLIYGRRYRFAKGNGEISRFRTLELWKG